MRSKAATAAAFSATMLLLTACNREQPAAAPSSEATTEATEAVATVEVPSADASVAASSALAAKLDMAALKERRDPERLLRFYTNAIRLGDWKDAARAWSLDAQMTPEKLENEFGGDAGPKLAVGKGDTEGAAGSIYYEAPLVIDFADGRPSRRGTIVLRRANDVPGASDEQLNWRIARTSTLPQ
ncbi:MAG TPA: hypothetical protein VJQ77_09885 [Novosphingobium sp.]|nr:hypothetical protein [Novosphingobium sp.]